MRAVYGNNAYKYETYETVKTTREPVRKVSKRNRRKTAIRNLVITGTVIVLAFCLLLRNAQIIDQTSRINQLKKEISVTESKLVEKQFSIEKQIDLQSVEQIAISEFGMQRPEKSQIVYLDMTSCDYAECEKQNKGGIFSAFIKSILE